MRDENGKMYTNNYGDVKDVDLNSQDEALKLVRKKRKGAEQQSE